MKDETANENKLNLVTIVVFIVESTQLLKNLTLFLSYYISIIIIA